MSDERERAGRQAQRSALSELWLALVRLRSVTRFLMVGAHPDDEASALLARLALGDGAETFYVCATRGAAGQNAIGPESGIDLAMIRSREMEEAARTLGLGLRWLETEPGDPIHDFGFAKTPEATFAVWGKERLIERLVRAIREVRPDMICPAFLDVPGQHGHHRAMAQATAAAFHQAADPKYLVGREEWAVPKLYLPAFSGAGATYDDEAPPPPATVFVDVGAYDRFLGATYAQIGEWSRACHRSQGMGRFRSETDARPIGLHLAESRRGLNAPERSVFDGLPTRLKDLANALQRPATDTLAEADAAIDAAIAAFPDFDRVAAACHRALAAIGRVDASGSLDIASRLDLKKRQLARASRLALSLVARIELPATVVLGEPAEAGMTLHCGGPGIPARLTLAGADGARFTLEEDRPFRPGFDPLAGNGRFAGIVRYNADGIVIEDRIEAEAAPVVLPPLSLEPLTDARVLIASSTTRMIDVEIAAHNNLGAALVATIRLETEAEAVRLQPGETARLRLRLTMPPAGLHRWRIGAEGCREGHVRRAHYPHIGRVSRIAPAEIRVLVLDLALPPTRRIGVIEGGSDRVGHWLDELGLGVEPIDDATLRGGDLSRFETILVGIKAFGQKPPLREAAATLRRFVAEGGHLVTLYQRPGDGWTPPAPIEIGSPSIRWRVADPAAPVKVLEPAHSLLSTPNRIVTADWEGWQKERGLYFASRWDEAYEPLIQLSDPGEEPLKGALISGPIGKGRHTHVSLAIHHQLKALVPGAFRLLANLVQPA